MTHSAKVPPTPRKYVLPMRARSTALGIGIVGGGAIADVYFRARSLPAGCRIVALADHDPVVLRDRVGVLGGVAAYAELDDFLADSAIDAVVVALPHHLHCAAAIRALEAGKHVVCEKPLGLNIDEVRAVEAAQARTDRRVLVRCYLRALDHHEWIREAISNRLLGDVVLLRGHFASDRRAALTSGDDWHGRWDFAGGGVVADSGYHLIDLSRHWLGEVVMVEARMWSTLPPGDRPEDVALIRLEHASGATSSLSFVWRDDVHPFRWEREVYGSGGSAFVADIDGASVLSAKPSVGPAVTRSVEGWWQAANERALAACLAALVNDGYPSDGAVDLHDAAETSRVVQAAYLSAERSTPVRPDTVPDEYRAGPEVLHAECVGSSSHRSTK
jgi:predicted dehydrogenase